MEDILQTRPNKHHASWAQRLFGFSGDSRPAPMSPSAASPSAKSQPSQKAGSTASAGKAAEVVRQLVADERYAVLLNSQAEGEVDDLAARPAWRALWERTALIPEGVITVPQPDGSLGRVKVPGFHIDRYAVTNAQYARFVHSGGYEEIEAWPREVWPSLMRFVDQTGRPGPRWWRHGNPPAGLNEHPVVGICWYEVNVYAAWVGKRLPQAVEWQKAAGWPDKSGDGECRSYAWGEVLSEGRANLLSTGLRRTVSVSDFATGSTPNGILQMTGNVWEWLADPLTFLASHKGGIVQSDSTLRRIIGGAFDTYLHGEASTRFVTGQQEFDRRANIGFRLVVPLDRLRRSQGTDPTA
jgi:gamma-glutamyl hercynylcysteine S-oxide synthase